MRILIVEDSPLVQKMYGLVFPKREHEMITALNGREALGVLQSSSDPFDLILLDLRMPDMNGVEFIQALRHVGPPLDTIPIVLTTAEPDNSPLLQHARALGVSAVARKPWKPHELREVIRSITPQIIG
jgi:CheY-like chemotaxis protein